MNTNNNMNGKIPGTTVTVAAKEYIYEKTICILLCLSVCSCGKISHKTRENKASYDCELSSNGKTVSFMLDNNTKYQFTALFPYTDKKAGKEYLTFVNSNDEILFYDLKQGDFLFKIKVRKEGPDGVPGLSGYYIEDFDNIYLTSVMPEITKTDTTGHVIRRIKYRATATGYQVTPTFKSWSYLYSPLCIIDGKLYITQNPYQKSVVSKTPVSVVIDTLNETASELPFFYPPVIKDEEFLHTSGFTLAKSRDFNGREFVYSFYFDENIYIASADHEKVESVPAKSKYINRLTVGKRPDDIIRMMKNDLEIPYYGNLLYDRFRNVYYRLAYPRVEIEDGLDYRSLTSQGRKKFSVIILDKDFNIIGETLFPEFI
jgi:hypothetical protein